ncbi:MAG: hypothetical protein ACE14S_04835 [Candidatus Bathyarchaeia archaeon]
MSILLSLFLGAQTPAVLSNPDPPNPDELVNNFNDNAMDAAVWEVERVYLVGWRRSSIRVMSRENASLW